MYKSILIILMALTAFSCKKEKSDPIKTELSGTFTDNRDGQLYKWVKIGNQIWMAENLCASKYRNGDEIGTTTPADKSILTEINPKYQWAYEGLEANVKYYYGRLYTWHAVNDSRGLAPAGWHIPSDVEWKTLEMSLGMSQLAADDMEARGTNEASKLAGNSGLWMLGELKSNTNFGTSGFDALPGGFRWPAGLFAYMGSEANWWSATTSSNHTGDAISRTLDKSNSKILRHAYMKEFCFSVRCVKD